MTPNKRISLNIVATYGRSLFALVCGLFTSRWVLGALGEVDFGLYGVVGGITVFITLLNGILAGATGRYYAFAIGAAQKTDSVSGLEECRQWFSTSVLIHSAVPCFFLIVGYPLGIYAVENWLTIPAGKLDDCVWVFRFVCVTAFVSMVNAPFNAMYTAKQYIAELTVYSFVQTLVNAVFVFYMSTQLGEWLRKYALWSMAVAVTPQLLICFRAIKVFPECKFRFKYAWNTGRIKQLGQFAFWQAFGGLGAIMRGQGIQILINKYFGPTVNASMTIANSVSAQTQTLSAAMQGAFAPAIITACGAGDYPTMRRLAFKTCKFGMLLGMIFMLPLALELEGVLELWLKNPPRHTEELCLCVLLAAIIDKSTAGHMLAVNAKGKIAAYQAFLGGALIMTLPLAWVFVAMGWGVASVGWAIVLGTAMCAWGRVWFARFLVGMGGWHWVKKIMMPCSFVMAAAGGAGWLTSMAMEPGIFRIVCVSSVADIVLAGLAWRICLDRDEREFVISKIRDRLGRRGR